MWEKVTDRVTELVEQKLQKEAEYFLVDVKTLPGKKIQVFVDGDNGIAISKCAEISRYLERFLDEEGIAGPDYVLEVSSPGMDNPFRVQRQYKKRIGGEVDVVMFNGDKKHGILKNADKEKVVLELTKEPVKGKKKAKAPVEPIIEEIALSDIKSTTISFKF